MATGRPSLRRRLLALHRNFRGATMIARAFLSTDHPLLAHIIPIRRCNLACEYCNEYDDFSKPVPAGTMFARVDKLAELGTAVITISGGEPLLHPELDEIIRRIRRRGIIAGLITNGYLLVAADSNGSRSPSTTSPPTTCPKRALRFWIKNWSCSPSTPISTST